MNSYLGFCVGLISILTMTAVTALIALAVAAVWMFVLEQGKSLLDKFVVFLGGDR